MLRAGAVTTAVLFGSLRARGAALCEAEYVFDVARAFP
jgi:hypothetical protein